MNRTIYMILMLHAGLTASAQTLKERGGNDTLTLDLPSTILMAQRQSPSAQSARNTFLAAYWQFRYYLSGYLPSVTLTSSPYINKEINKITQADGSSLFMKQDQTGADISLTINQNIALTGGSLFVRSSLTRLDELRNKTTAYSSRPLIVGYEQSLFGHNPLRWDRRIEPARYREARKNYAETLELVAAEACNHFFALASALTEKDMAMQNFASSDTLYRMAQGRYAIGTITENEMLQLEINRLNEETNMMEADIVLENEMQSFRSYLGLVPTTRLTLTIPDSVPQLQIPLQEAMRLAIENSPDPEYYRRIVAESERNLASARANSRLKADIYMQLGLSAIGHDASSAYRHPDNQIYASLSVSLPILDWGRGKGQRMVAQSQLDMARMQAEQGMNDFSQNVQKLVMQFNMQGRRVTIASMTDRRAEQRHSVARHLYMTGRNSILDLNAAVSEKNAARRGYIYAMQTYYRLYYTIRSMTAFDFEHGRPLTVEPPIQ